MITKFPAKSDLTKRNVQNIITIIIIIQIYFTIITAVIIVIIAWILALLVQNWPKNSSFHLKSWIGGTLAIPPNQERLQSVPPEDEQTLSPDAKMLFLYKNKLMFFFT